MRRALPLVTLLAGMAVLPSAAMAGNLAVRSVSTARSATAGLPVAIEVTVARSGRTAAAEVRFYLSADAKRDRRDVRLKGEAAVGRGAGKRALHVSAHALVPAGQALGDYRLFACVEQGKRADCRAARRPLRVTAEPVGTRELVDAAVAAHRIAPEQGLAYRVFAAFGDRRLPAAYTGDDAAQEHKVMRDVAEAWPRLSARQRAQLSPFFVPPAAKGSWASRSAGASQRPAAASGFSCTSSQFADRRWRSMARLGGHVRIWWKRPLGAASAILRFGVPGERGQDAGLHRRLQPARLRRGHAGLRPPRPVGAA